jgi:hypothetical protein
MTEIQGGVGLLVAVLTLLGSSGCAVEFKYGAAPPRSKPQTANEECYNERRVEVSFGTADVTEPAARAMSGEFAIPVEYGREANGLIFYKGGVRLPIGMVLALLNDSELATAYASRVDELRADKNLYSVFLRSVGLTTLAMGSASLLGGCFYLAGHDTERTAQQNKTLGALFIGGAALDVIAIVIVASIKNKVNTSNEKYQVYSELFVERSLVARLVERIVAHNARAAAECGFDGKVGLSISQEFRAFP